jgi:ubiquinone/menaquinone biosynthesis C-methylase UbiE
VTVPVRGRNAEPRRAASAGGVQATLATTANCSSSERGAYMTTDLQKWFSRDGECFLRAIGMVRGATVLDFGCRRGTYAIPAARLVGTTGSVYAVDQKEDVLAALSQSAGDQGLVNLFCINTHGTVNVPLKSASVDVILLYDVIHLIGWTEDSPGNCHKSTAADRRRLLEEMHRIAKPGGLLSVYLQHLDTHTDAGSEVQIRLEIERCGFHLERELHRTLIHDEHPVRGRVLNFRRDPNKWS